jgi:GT2 family glycosyltransferase
MNNGPQISILIITYNRPEDALLLLENLKGQNCLQQNVGEILLLNNASTVSYEGIKKFKENNQQFALNYFEHDENLGVALGRNYLIKKAKFPLLLVLDDDVVFSDKNAIEQVATLFQKPQFLENNTAVITLNIFYFATGDRQKEALPHKNYEAYKNKDWFLTYYFTGAAHLMRRKLFDKTGYYPTDFFYGMEEYDLSYRILNAGYTLAFDASVKVLHKESPTGRLTNKAKVAMMWLNKCKVAWRYLPKKYFYSTAFMWSLFYLKKTGFDFKGFLQTFKKIKSIPANNSIQKIDTRALEYLKKVKARLWF